MHNLDRVPEVRNGYQISTEAEFFSEGFLRLSWARIKIYLLTYISFDDKQANEIHPLFPVILFDINFQKCDLSDGQMIRNLWWKTPICDNFPKDLKSIRTQWLGLKK